jgi:hypothetical protein
MAERSQFSRRYKSYGTKPISDNHRLINQLQVPPELLAGAGAVGETKPLTGLAGNGTGTIQFDQESFAKSEGSQFLRLWAKVFSP